MSGWDRSNKLNRGTDRVGRDTESLQGTTGLHCLSLSGGRRSKNAPGIVPARNGQRRCQYIYTTHSLAPLFHYTSSHIPPPNWFFVDGYWVYNITMVTHSRKLSHFPNQLICLKYFFAKWIVFGFFIIYEKNYFNAHIHERISYFLNFYEFFNHKLNETQYFFKKRIFYNSWIIFERAAVEYKMLNIYLMKMCITGGVDRNNAYIFGPKPWAVFLVPIPSNLARWWWWWWCLGRSPVLHERNLKHDDGDVACLLYFCCCCCFYTAS